MIPRHVKNEVGNTFGRLTVLSYHDRGVWLCQCSCGKQALAPGQGLRRGSYISCGCWRAEFLANGRLRHGEAKHGRQTAEYLAWREMKNRCFNSKNIGYASYGGRGITVCDRWLHSFENFLADMGRRPSPRHSIDRKDNDGNYEPGNCRWATVKEQGANRRTNRLLTFQGRTQIMQEWATEKGMCVQTLFGRLKSGWSVEHALTIPRTLSKTVRAGYLERMAETREPDMTAAELERLVRL